jgi:hypothetical protein
VSKAGFPGHLIFGAYMIPDIHCHNRGLVVFMDNEAQAIGKGEFFVRNINGIRVINRIILCTDRYRDEKHQQFWKKKITH